MYVNIPVFCMIRSYENVGRRMLFLSVTVLVDRVRVTWTETGEAGSNQKLVL